jgi:hypothetical protein
MHSGARIYRGAVWSVGCGTAQQSTAPDCLQPTLVPRSGFRQQVSASVRQQASSVQGVTHELARAMASGKASHVRFSRAIVEEGRARGPKGREDLEKEIWPKAASARSL